MNQKCGHTHEEIAVEVVRDKKTGRRSAECPIEGCNHTVHAMTAYGAAESLTEHMNAIHYRPEKGNA